MRYLKLGTEYAIGGALLGVSCLLVAGYFVVVLVKSARGSGAAPERDGETDSMSGQKNRLWQ